MKNKNLCIIQARMGSTRLPGKTLMKVGGIPMLEYEIKRVLQSKYVDKIVVATTANKEDNAIEAFCKRAGVDCFRGSADDVLGRYYECASRYPQYQNIVRITGDCPLIDPFVIDRVIAHFLDCKVDYASNVLKETFPDGMDVEIFTKVALVEAQHKAALSSEREHVTLYIRKRKKFKKTNVPAEHNFSHFRLTLDRSEDFGFNTAVLPMSICRTSPF